MRKTLDTYHAERQPVAARVLRNTMAQVAIRRQDHRTKALGDTVSKFLGMDEPRQRLAAEISDLAFTTILGRGTLCSVCRMTDHYLVTANFPLLLRRLLMPHHIAV